tara:strand:- start:498 stop:698 length:201 start_codon:yes stop_codon:yes gene_type:complete
MARGVPHFTKDGSLFKGKMHKMKDGTVHTGASHTSSSKELFHIGDLPKPVRRKALVAMLKARKASA